MVTGFTTMPDSNFFTCAHLRGLLVRRRDCGGSRRCRRPAPWRWRAAPRSPCPWPTTGSGYAARWRGSRACRRRPRPAARRRRPGCISTSSKVSATSESCGNLLFWRLPFGHRPTSSTGGTGVFTSRSTRREASGWRLPLAACPGFGKVRHRILLTPSSRSRPSAPCASADPRAR